MDVKKRSKIELRKVNWLLLTAIILINGWIIGLPLYTIATLWVQDHLKHTPQHLSQLITSHEVTPSNKNAPPPPPGERLIIPAISLNQDIHEGSSIYTVNQGVWHYSKGSSPGKSGNTVLIGHRFTYTGPSVFAHLNLVKLGDPIAVWWNGTQYVYKVDKIEVVPPSDTSIVQPTSDTRLTIYTCTPMWSTTNRLAVIAEQETPNE